MAATCWLARVEKVRCYEDLTPEPLGQLRDKYNQFILGPGEYWADKAEARYGFLAWLGGVRRIEPLKIDKKDWRAWVVLREGADFGLLDVVKGYLQGDG